VNTPAPGPTPTGTPAAGGPRLHRRRRRKPWPCRRLGRRGEGLTPVGRIAADHGQDPQACGLVHRDLGGRAPWSRTVRWSAPALPSRPFQQRRTVPCLTTRLPWWSHPMAGNRINRSSASLSQLWPRWRDHALLGWGRAGSFGRSSQGHQGRGIPARNRVLRHGVADGAHPSAVVPRRWGCSGSRRIHHRPGPSGGSRFFGREVPGRRKVRSGNIRCSPSRRNAG